MFEFLARGKARAEDTNAFLVFYAHECLAATVQTAVFFRQQIFFFAGCVLLKLQTLTFLLHIYQNVNHLKSCQNLNFINESGHKIPV